MYFSINSMNLDLEILKILSRGGKRKEEDKHSQPVGPKAH